MSVSSAAQSARPLREQLSATPAAREGRVSEVTARLRMGATYAPRDVARCIGDALLGA